MPRCTSTNSLDKDNLLDKWIPTLPILTRAQHRRFIKEQRTIIRTLIRDFFPERQVFYTFFDTPRIVQKDALEDILGIQHIFNEIIFDQRSRTVYVLGPLTRLRGEQDDIPEDPPQFNSDGNQIHTDEEFDKTYGLSQNYMNETMGSKKLCWGSRNSVVWIVMGLISCQKGDSTPWAGARFINGGVLAAQVDRGKITKGDTFFFTTFV